MLDYTLPADDPLGVLTSTRFVVEQAESVRIDPGALTRIAAELGSLLSEPPEWHDARHFADGTWRTAGWVLTLDALNFCFWSTGPDRWQVEWQGRLEDGYWALAAALLRAVEEGRPVWDPRYLAKLTPRDVAHILRPYDGEGPEIPLFPLRVQNLHEIARGLLEGFPEAKAPVEALIQGADGSAVALVREVVARFPSFNDVAQYRDQEVRFYKRAQIFVADLAGAFDGRGLGAFHDLNQLTAFADYKVPQVLRGFGGLVYAPELDTAIAARRLIPLGSAWEVEIRAATIWACELLRRTLAGQGQLFRATEIDWILWLAGQSLPAKMPPYHRTLTMFY
jgi:hypothetical protein